MCRVIIVQSRRGAYYSFMTINIGVEGTQAIWIVLSITRFGTVHNLFTKNMTKENVSVKCTHNIHRLPLATLSRNRFVLIWMLKSIRNFI